jgi:anaerobic selenocysteine-containing dehydrogenase
MSVTPTTSELVDHRTFCRFCVALCGLVVTTDGERVVRVRGDDEHPLSRGYTCAKGRALGAAHHDPRRLDRPLIRRDGALVEVSWAELLDDLTPRVIDVIAEGGPDAVGSYVATASAFDANGRRIGERLFRAIGSRSKYSTTTIDTPCKPLVSELMTGYPGLIPTLDHDHAGLVVLIGVNPVVSHGHFNGFPDPVTRLRRLAARGELWVVDPRRTETAKLATTHVAPKPGTDYAIVAHAIRELLRDGAAQPHLAARASGLDELRTAVEPFDRDRTSQRCGVDPEVLDRLVAAIRTHGRVAVQTGTGATMAEAANVTEWLVWALHVVTDSWERPGGMWFNPGFLRQLDTRSVRRPAGAAAPGPRSRPDLPARWGEYPCAAFADEVEAGNLRALFVLGGNPVTSLPNSARVRAALGALDVLVVSDVVHTETTELATHVLPCLGQLERPDVPHFIDQYQTMVASQYTAPVVAPVAERKPMWWPLAHLARRLGHDILDGRDPDAVTDEELVDELACRSRSGTAALRGHPTALVSERVAEPWVERTVLADDRWQLAPAELVSQLEQLEQLEREATATSLVLTPRRQLRHLNSQLRDVAAPGGRSDRPEVLINPDDAAAVGVADGAPIAVRSARGVIRAQARVDPDIRAGVVSVPHGFAAPNVSDLTDDVALLDPLTGMVRQSGLPVTVSPDEPRR